LSDEPKRKRGQRGPDLKPRKQRGKTSVMQVVTIRLPPDVIEYYGGSSARMREALQAYMRENSV
jgi:uncharacterized protein (DUF4415 family)